MERTHILIIEDDEDIQQLVSFNLIKAGFTVSCADSGEEGLSLLETEKIDCVLLDLMMPGENGIEICKQIRADEQLANLPVIMMTALGEEQEVVTGLESGADDYITKPFSPKVLVARVKAVLRRDAKRPAANEPDQEVIISIHGIEINQSRNEVRVNGHQIKMTMTEFSVLTHLAQRPGWVFSREQLINAVRGSGYNVTPRMIDVQISSIRKKLGIVGVNIETMRGVGYRLKDM